MDPMGGIVMTNDGNAILREITVQHPAAKTMIEIARTQDEEVGDGTTSVIVLASEVLGVSQQFLEDKMHPTLIISAYRQALEDAVRILEDQVAFDVDINDEKEMIKVIQSCIGTKFISRWADLACQIALRAVKTVVMEQDGEIDTKRYAKIEKIPGGIMKEDDFSKILEMEESYIKKICEEIIKFKPDLVITEKGVSDLAQHFLSKADITVIRRLRKTDNLRVARACGATIVNRTDEITEDDIGTGAGLFE